MRETVGERRACVCEHPYSEGASGREREEDKPQALSDKDKSKHTNDGVHTAKKMTKESEGRQRDGTKMRIVKGTGPAPHSRN